MKAKFRINKAKIFYLVQFFAVSLMVMLLVCHQPPGIERHPVIDLSGQITIVDGMSAVTKTSMLKKSGVLLRIIF